MKAGSDSERLLLDLIGNKSLLSFTDRSNQTVSYDIYPANIVWDLGDPLAEEIAENRFHDNDELKYSLRSLEQHAPWFRRVYIVTNGQVPDWLNISHPKIRMVNHRDMFANKSHLPTFSSPAIEANLHRIEGLSKRFVYFNDDLLLGKRVWPEDFYTRSNGYKVFLAWILPGCNPSCPSTWIRDG
jgi:UDP-N-acetylglucosamine-lysosomal-enzyme